jgi:hypothetical protein
MATLETSYGWVQGDQVRLLIAAGLTIGSYQIEQITIDMNTLGEISTDAVTNVRNLLTDFENAQTRYQTLNAEGDNRVLVKADVLEWEQNTGFRYDPQSEFNRVRGLLEQYFGFSTLFESGGDYTQIIRS